VFHDARDLLKGAVACIDIGFAQLGCDQIPDTKDIKNIKVLDLSEIGPLLSDAVAYVRHHSTG